MYDGISSTRTDPVCGNDTPEPSAILGKQTAFVVELYADEHGDLRIAGSNHAVIAAVSCLVRPLAGDRVRVLADDQCFFVIDVLTRSHGDAPLIIGQAARKMELHGLDLRIEAQDAIELQAPLISLHSGTGSWMSASLRHVANTWRLEAGYAHREVEQVDSTHARHVVHAATQGMALRCRVGSIQADAVLRIDGGQVHMG